MAVKDFNLMTLNEVLDAINEDITLLDKGSMFEFHRNSPIAQVFNAAFLDEYKFLLPDGIPPYTPAKEKAGLTAGDLMTFIRRRQFDYLRDPAVKAFKREQIFINLLETVCEEEARVLLAIKEQQLELLYPNITYRTLAEAGYLPVLEDYPLPASNKSSPYEQLVETLAGIDVDAAENQQMEISDQDVETRAELDEVPAEKPSKPPVEIRPKAVRKPVGRTTKPKTTRRKSTTKSKEKPVESAAV